MAEYKSPGIYLEEIPDLPPSIKRGKTTAVLIGYTEKHENQLGESLLNIPTEITSIFEFETLFGKAQVEENLVIIDNSVGDIENISVQFNDLQSSHNLYYSLVSFFNNNGKSCKIISVGTFKNLEEKLSASELISGLKSLSNEKENLLICIPESQNLEEEDFYLLQNEVLDFCATHLHFSIFNVPKSTKENFYNVVKITVIKR